jgi:hypothetical protein
VRGSSRTRFSYAKRRRWRGLAETRRTFENPRTSTTPANSTRSELLQNRGGSRRSRSRTSSGIPGPRRRGLRLGRLHRDSGHASRPPPDWCRFRGAPSRNWRWFWDKPVGNHTSAPTGIRLKTSSRAYLLPSISFSTVLLWHRAGKQMLRGQGLPAARGPACLERHRTQTRITKRSKFGPLFSIKAPRGSQFRPRPNNHNATKCDKMQRQTVLSKRKAPGRLHCGHPAHQPMPRPKIPSNPMIPNALSDIGFVWSRKEFRHRHAQFRTTKPTATPPAVHLPKPPSYRRSSAANTPSKTHPPTPAPAHHPTRYNEPLHTPQPPT